MAPAFRDIRNLLSTGYRCLAHTQLGRSGAPEVLSTSTSWRSQHTTGAHHPPDGGTAASLKTTASLVPDAEPPAPGAHASGSGAEADDLPTPPPVRFVSSEQRTAKLPPKRRIPICFPDMVLQMMRLEEQELQQLQETGWLREVAFKTTPNVTKFEIAAFLESVYGMSVERVHTINYLGRKRSLMSKTGKKLVFREDDWKKAYVIFRPPPGLEHLLETSETTERARDEEELAEEEGLQEEEEEEVRSMLERVREAARAPKRGTRVENKWKRDRQDGKDGGSQ